MKEEYNLTDFIDMINKNEVVIPSIQRGGVWKDKQVIKCFDSLCKNIPMGAIVYGEMGNNTWIKAREYTINWELNNSKIFSEYNRTVGIGTKIMIDGQQRTQCINTVCKDGFFQWGVNKKKKLYFNLLKEEESKDNFKTRISLFKYNESEAFIKEDSIYIKFSLLYKILYKKIIENLNPNECREILKNLLITNNINFDNNFISDSWSLINDTIGNSILFKSNYSVLSFQPHNNLTIETAADIFERVNGGTKLSSSDFVWCCVKLRDQDGQKRFEKLSEEIDGYIKSDILLEIFYSLHKKESKSMGEINNDKEFLNSIYKENLMKDFEEMIKKYISMLRNFTISKIVFGDMGWQYPIMKFFMLNKNLLDESMESNKLIDVRKYLLKIILGKYTRRDRKTETRLMNMIQGNKFPVEDIILYLEKEGKVNLNIDLDDEKNEDFFLSNVLFNTNESLKIKKDKLDKDHIYPVKPRSGEYDKDFEDNYKDSIWNKAPLNNNINKRKTNQDPSEYYNNCIEWTRKLYIPIEFINNPKKCIIKRKENMILRIKEFFKNSNIDIEIDLTDNEKRFLGEDN